MKDQPMPPAAVIQDIRKPAPPKAVADDILIAKALEGGKDDSGIGSESIGDEESGR